MWKVKMETTKGYNEMCFVFETLQNAVNFIQEATVHCTEGIEFKIWLVEEGEEEC